MFFQSGGRDLRKKSPGSNHDDTPSVERLNPEPEKEDLQAARHAHMRAIPALQWQTVTGWPHSQ